MRAVEWLYRRGLWVPAGVWMLGLLSGASAAWAQSVSEATQDVAGERALPDPVFDPAYHDALRGEGEPLTAQEAAAQAMATAPALEHAQATIDEAEAAASEAWLAVYPRLEVTASYTRLSHITPPLLPTGGRFPVFLNRYWVQPAVVTVPLSDILLTILPRYRAAAGFAEAERSRMVAEQANVALRGYEAFYTLVRARAAALVAEDAVVQADVISRDTEALVAGGLLPTVERARVESRAAAARVMLARAREAEAVSQRALNVLLHRRLSDPVAIAEDLEAPVPAPEADLDTLTAQALHMRPEVTALRRMAEAQGEVVQAQSNRRLPRLALHGQVDIARPNPRFIPQRDRFDTTWEAGAMISWSPNDWWAADRASDGARAGLARMQADLATLEDNLRVEVAEAYERALASRVALDAARSGLQAATESFEVRKRQYRAGAVVLGDLVDAELELRRARLDLIHVYVDQRLARARLQRAIGQPLAP